MAVGCGKIAAAASHRHRRNPDIVLIDAGNPSRAVVEELTQAAIEAGVPAFTVTLCSLWPTLINTSLAVASLDKDLVNVSRVLKLSIRTKITRLVLPSALPLIFTGLRLSLGVGWMVLIAAKMLAQRCWRRQAICCKNRWRRGG